MRDRGIKCYKSHCKDPAAHKRPTTFSVPLLIHEHWGSQQWGEALNPLYHTRTGQSLSPWASLPSPGRPAMGWVSCSCHCLHLPAWGDAKIGSWGINVEEMTCRQGHPSIIFRMENDLCLASEGVFAYNLEGKRRKHWNTFFQQANSRLSTASGKLKHPQSFFPHRVVILIK